MIAAQVHENDVVRLTPGGPACRVYRDRTRSKDTVEHLTVDGLAMVRFTAGCGVGASLVTLPADAEVELVARHGNRRTVSLTKAWYLGPIGVGAVVVYRHAPTGTVFRVADIEHGPVTRYYLAPYDGGDVTVTDARVGDLSLVRSHALEAVRRATDTRHVSDEPQAALFGAGDAA